MHILCMICVQLSFCPDDMRETNKYSNEIINVLCEAGDNGLPVRKIALHVYNTCNTLFTPVHIDDIYNCVRQWLNANSQSYDSLVCRCDKRGYYKINTSSQAAQQLMLEFSDDNYEPSLQEEPQNIEPEMGFLFDDML